MRRIAKAVVRARFEVATQLFLCGNLSRRLWARIAFVSLFGWAGVSSATLQWQTAPLHDPLIFYGLGQHALLLDNDGQPHIFYGFTHLQHSYKVNGKWVIEIIDPRSKTGAKAYAVRDALGYFHVFYQYSKIISESQSNRSTVTAYATNKNGKWQVEDLPAPIQSRWLAVGSDGMPRALYRDENGYVIYAEKVSGEWKSRNTNFHPILDTQGETFTGLSFALDSNNLPHFIFPVRPVNAVSTGESQLMHAYWNGNSWLSETIAESHSGASAYQNSSLSIDKSDHLHIAFPDERDAGGGIYYANNVNRNWKISKIDEFGRFPSLVLDADGYVHVAHIKGEYSDGVQSFLCSYVTNKNGNWVSGSVPGAKWADLNTAIAVDSAGNPHVACFDDLTAALNYSVFKNNTWENTVVAVQAGVRPDGFGGPGSQSLSSRTGISPSVAIDGDSFTHLVYASDGIPFSNSLYYTSNKTGQWKAERIVVGSSRLGNVNATGIVVDANGSAHVVVGDGENLRYLTNKNGVWESIDIGVNDNIQKYYDERNSIWLSKVAIAVDSAGKVYLLYNTNTGNEASVIHIASNASGYWRSEILTERAAMVADIAVDSRGSINVGFLDDKKNVILARKKQDSWTFETIVANDSRYTWGEAAIRMRPNGVLEMAFQSLYCNDFTCVVLGLEFATNRSGKWEREFIERTGRSTDNTFDDIQSITLAEVDGNAVVGYISAVEGFELGSRETAFKIAEKIGSLWRPSVIDNGLGAGRFSAITLAADGGINVAYYDVNSSSLKVANSTLVSAPMIDLELLNGLQSYGNIEIGAQGTRELVIKNIGQKDLLVTDVEILADSHNGDFVLDGSLGKKPCGDTSSVTVAPADHCTIGIVFKPSTIDTVKFAVRLVNNDPDIRDVYVGFDGKGQLASQTAPSEPISQDVGTGKKSPEPISEDAGAGKKTLLGGFGVYEYVLASLFLVLLRARRCWVTARIRTVKGNKPRRYIESSLYSHFRIFEQVEPKIILLVAGFVGRIPPITR